MGKDGSTQSLVYNLQFMSGNKGKVIPLQAQCGPECGQRYSSTLP